MFAHGRNEYKNVYSHLGFKSPFDHGGGLGLYIQSGLLPFQAYNITLYNCSVYKNTAPLGANMFLYVDVPVNSKIVTVYANNCKIFGGNSTSKGGGLMLQVAYDMNGLFFNHYESLYVFLANSELYSNSAANGGGLGIYIELRYQEVEVVNITVYNCSMHKNTASVGANMFLSVDVPDNRLITVRIDNCKFFGGKSTSKGGGLMLQIDNDFNFRGNLTVYLANSELYGNSAANGGGLYLGVQCENVYILGKNERIMFIIQQCICRDNVGKNGSGMSILIDSPMESFGISLTIHNLTFAGNSLTGGDLFNSTYIQNAAHCGGSTVYISAPVDPKLYQVTLMSTIFQRNFMLTNTHTREHDCAVLCLSHVKNITI